MRKLPIILTLVLIAAWAYTSWYWYTCNIKGFCDGNINYSADKAQQNSASSENSTYSSQSLKNGNIEKEDPITITATGSPKLSVEDVLFDPLPKEVEETVETQGRGPTQSGSITDGKNDTMQETENQEVSSQTTTICEDPLVGPIAFGKDNNVEEVKKLEKFLQARYPDLDTTLGVYDENDFEVMKKFQLEFKQEVLDPWGITAPTGYVGKTSIAKIQELACK